MLIWELSREPEQVQTGWRVPSWIDRKESGSDHGALIELHLEYNDIECSTSRLLKLLSRWQLLQRRYDSIQSSFVLIAHHILHVPVVTLHQLNFSMSLSHELSPQHKLQYHQIINTSTVIYSGKIFYGTLRLGILSSFGFLGIMRRDEAPDVASRCQRRASSSY